MKVNMGQPNEALASSNPNRGRVVVSTHPVRQRMMFDIDGNQIDPRTKKIIKLAKDIEY